LVEDVVVADVYESADGEEEIVVVEVYETATPVSFDEALNGYAQPDAGEGSGEQETYAPEGEEQQATEFEPGAFEPEPQQPPAAPSYDASQSWESQLAPQTDANAAPPANPFAPVTQPAEGEGSGASGNEGEPAVAPEDEEPAPYTPPSSRMFNDLYGNQRPEQGN
jgi:hypothetical protein